MPGAAALPPTADAMHIIVIDQAGQRHRLEALDGFRVMEIIRDWGLDINAECGGACACATCHVTVGAAFVDLLPPRLAEEEDRLDEAFGVTAASRLSCQLIMSEALDGLEVTLMAGSERDRRAA